MNRHRLDERVKMWYLDFVIPRVPCSCSGGLRSGLGLLSLNENAEAETLRTTAVLLYRRYRAAALVYSWGSASDARAADARRQARVAESSQICSRICADGTPAAEAPATPSVECSGVGCAWADLLVGRSLLKGLRRQALIQPQNVVNFPEAVKQLHEGRITQQ